ncbi:ABC transporter substrate-binding protein [Ethanoligenens harbinense]|uniref:Extracellular solute-binding protein family 1 n=1 Tax=Ethanoligenens harbinense (strain DSM 18485 / JCM 12961 / CGMCC 1.5033 / YUAN-3) TaxID=663278 RepID=E6U2M4_ETHHY|nr:extracellular solute-binding protein [Ethanoligenens harbinense]ADU26315.1 extracellular solute-binding protein family 1 [Ethanoligenens harbinense YUAN-3]AVQ95448.1 sugar ABC transporter substrate-binding protein [Ethanoligenens harbinense YUAN-3]AYF38113.1 sugar ABC transporter substrate-binding protein [Ethanoligenens harbinense]AYF40858.1 sugar ABC transporter substrate-binding protein [Ethanoligenens harbinense]QCN91688.1 extracellular solute-binding protein [Ethanoligenens harbinense]
MKKSKLAALGLAAALMVGTFAGCSSGTTSGKKVTIDIYQFKVETKSALDKAIAQYEKENPNVTINEQTVGGGGDYAGTLKTKFSSGQEPAIYNIFGQTDTHTWKDKDVDLSNESWVSQAVSGTLGGATLDGKVYGMPFDLEGYGLLYNKTVFQKAGIDASKLTTMDAIEQAYATLDSQKSKLGLTAVTAWAAKETWVTANHGMNPFVAPEFKDDEAAYNSKTLAFNYSDGFKKYVDLNIKYSYKPNGSASSINSIDYTTQVEQLFALGKVAVIQQGNWVIPTIKGIDPDLAKNVGIIPIPVESSAGTITGKIPVGVAAYWAINKDKDADTIAACKKFLNWLYQSDEGKKMIVNNFGFIPPFKNYSASLVSNLDPLSQDIEKYASAGNTISWVFNDYPSGYTDKVGADISKYIAGQLSWDQFVTNTKNNWSSLRQ